jgi:hypothetical protein
MAAVTVPAVPFRGQEMPVSALPFADEPVVLIE